MWWRQTRSEFGRNRGEPNRLAFKQIVERGEVPGLLAYAGGKPVGWCSVGPRETFSALERSRTLKRVDNEPVWSVVCFFVARGYRRQGLTAQLLKAAIDYVRQQGGKIVEGYPHRPSKKQADVFVYTGLASAFEKVGFQEVARPSPTRSIMRYIITGEC